MRRALLLLLAAMPLVAAPRLELRPGDHVALVGAGAMERLHLRGDLEALLHAAHPGHRLVVRNLGFAGDEVGLRPRSDGTPPLDFFLDMKPGVRRARWGSGVGEYHVGAPFHANVIVAQWGFNESFAGPAGLDPFRRALDAWVGTQLATDRGRGPTRLALLSPQAMEDLPIFPRGHVAARNADLAAYAAVVRDVAAARGLPFVDVFALTQRAYRESDRPLTLHGIHLDVAGESALALRLLEALLGRPASAEAPPALRALVRQKGAEWRARYRVIDQFNTYGARSRIAYADHRDPSRSVTNARILNQEMARRDVRTARLDAAIWEAAAGGKPTVDLVSGLPPVDPVPANLPARPPLSGAETLRHLKVAEGCKVELAADEAAFPDLANPVQMAFDPRGRLWVATWPTYPSRRPGDARSDKLLVLDLDPATGKVVRSTVFLDGLNAPTGFQFHRDGVLVVQAPDLILARDTDGDGRADSVEPVLHGIDSADTHHTANSLTREPGGAITLSDGVFHRAAFETPWGPVRNADGAVYRHEPLTGRVTRHAPYAFANPHGRVLDRWGDDLIIDATGNHTYFGPAISGHLDAGKHPEFPELWSRPSRPSPGGAILSSRHFPDDWQGLYLNLNVIGFRGIHRVRLSEDGAGLRGEGLAEGLLWATDAAPNFRPVAAAVAPDGSVYVLDWCQQLIGHLQHHLRDPNRDDRHGRIFRITYPSRPLLAPKPVAGRPIPELLALLGEPEDGVRERARLELEGRDPAAVLAAARAFLAAADRAAPGFEHHRLEILWLHEALLAPEPDLLRSVLGSPEPRARAAAVRVLCHWRDRLADPLALLAPLAADPHPRVRLEVARVASFFRDADAARAARLLVPMLGETERHLAFVVRQSSLQLRRFPEAAAVLAAPAPGAPPADDAPADLKGEARELYILGREVFLRDGHCATCHQKDGRGMTGVYPPLDARRWLEDDTRLAKIVLHGLHGALRVRGEPYGSAPGSPPMPGFGALLDDREVAGVLTYVRRSFGNRLPPVSPATVARVRAEHAGRTAFWTGAELAPGGREGR